MTDTMITDTRGTRYWYRDGRLHRDSDLPAVTCADGTRHWYRDGRPHRDGDLPAVTHAGGTRHWYRNGIEVDSYYPAFGCASTRLTTRAEALARLDARPRPFSRAHYLADIDARWPEAANDVA